MVAGIEIACGIVRGNHNECVNRYHKLSIDVASCRHGLLLDSSEISPSFACE